MKALIDGDILLYRIGYTTENVDINIAVWRMDEILHSILHSTGATEHWVALSDGRESTFRALLYPEYKANRVQPKPLHYEELKKYLVQEWGGVVEKGQEADDRLGIEQNENTIICTIDKDLKQVPGHHYNFVKGEFDYVTEEEGLLFFYKQLLIGDTTDNIKGITGIGKGKADKLLNDLIGEDEETIYLKVEEAYKKWLLKEWCAPHDGWNDFKQKQMLNIITLNGRLLKIRRKENEIWNLPISQCFSPEVELAFGSTAPTEAEIDHYTEQST